MAEQTDAHGLKKHDVKVWTVVCMIFCLVSAGAYGIEEMIPESGPGLTILMLIIIPFIWGAPLGLVASELGSARPQEGGYYKWVQEALGEFWGFQAGWWRTISIYIDNTLYVILAGGYLANTWNLTWGQEMAAKLAIIGIFTYINIKGVRDVGIISAILSVLTIVAFAMVTICGFMNWHQNPILPFTADGEIAGVSGILFKDWVYYIGMGTALGMWMYSGYESMSTIAGEIKDPQVIPKATVVTVPLIMAVYIFPTIAGLASLGDWENWGTENGNTGYADVVTTYWGESFGVFFVIIAILAQCSIYNTYIASGSRGFFTLADDYLCPPIFVKCDRKNGVPYISVLSVAVVNIILSQFAFKTVVVVDVFLLMSSYIMIFVSAIILRKRIPAAEYKFRLPGGNALFYPICIVPIAVGIAAFFINGADYFIGGMAGILSGPLVYFVWKRKYKGLTNKNPLLYPLNPHTGLAPGDLKRMSFLFGILAVMSAAAVPWLRWFEADWGVENHLSTYGSGFLSDFNMVINAIGIGAAVFAVLAALMFALSKKYEKKEKVFAREATTVMK